jgi:MtN3 and saliva related transmembrane protein
MTYVPALDNDVLGYLAGALTTLAFLPQVLRIVRTRSARDVSWGMIAMFCVGVSLWLWYGIRLASLPLIAANGVTLVLVLTMLVLKLRYRPRTTPRQRGRGREAKETQ